MITVSRRRLRALRSVLRRPALGLPRRGAVPPLIFCADPGRGLRVRYGCDAVAVEASLPGRPRATEAIALPLDALAEAEGPTDSPVMIEAIGPGRTSMRWEGRGIPQSREYPVPEAGAPAAFPGPPSFASMSPGFPEALAAATRVVGDASARHDLSCLQLRGASGELAATDGRQLLLQGVGPLPWADDVLVRAVPLLAARALPRDRPASIGRADGHVVLRLGEWTIGLPIRAGGRFPRIDGVVPSEAERATRLALDPADAAFLRVALGRLPGAEDEHAPATLDLNGRVAVRAREGTGAMELVLLRSTFTGPPLRLASDRRYLARAVALGLRSIELAGPDRPVVARDSSRTYCWQPLSADATVPADGEIARVLSTAVPPDVPPPTGPPRMPMPETNGHATRPPADVAATPPGGNGLAGLVAEAQALHATLADARSRTARLVAGLRRHRKQARLLGDTLRSLRELKLAEAVE
jgi:hypothetical protein